MTATRPPAPEPTRLKVLDACLSHLEEANEQGVAILSDRLAATLAVHVRGLRRGMSVQDAVALVFEQQERLLRSGRFDGDPQRPPASPPEDMHRGSTPGRAVAVAAEPRLGGPRDGQYGSQRPSLNEQEARDLTDRIKNDLTSVCLLVVAAHDGRAWIPLGYGTWEAYVRAEFGLSRSRSYELVTQGRVVRTIQAAAGMSGMPDISSRVAIRIRPRLSEVENAIHDAVSEGVTEEEAANLVVRIVKEQQRAFRRSSGSRALSVGPHNADRTGSTQDTRDSNLRETPWIDDHGGFSLGDVVEYLANLPPVPELLILIADHHAGQFTHLDRAARWLSELAAAWSSEKLPMTARATSRGSELRA